MSYKDRLSKLGKAWENSKPAAGAGKLPEGKYQFTIKRAALEESKMDWNKGHLTVNYTLEVATGPMKGRKGFINVDLESDGNKGQFPTGMAIFKGHLDTLKVEIPKQLSEASIKKVLETLIGIVCNGAVVHNKKGYANIYLNDLVNAASEEEDDEDAVEEDEDEDDEDEDDEKEDDSEDDDSEDDDEDDDEDEEEEVKKPTDGKKPPFKPTPGKAKEEKPTKPEKKKPEKKEEADEDSDEDDWEL